MKWEKFRIPHDNSNVEIVVKLLANMIQKAGAEHIMMLDPHSPQLVGFFDIPVDALKVLVKRIITCLQCHFKKAQAYAQTPRTKAGIY